MSLVLRCALLAVLAASASGCNRPKRSVAAPPESPKVELPDDIPGFSAGPPSTPGGAVRRTYFRGNARVSVTLAQFEMTAAQYERWVQTSTQGFQLASLDVSPGTGSGFYQCTEGEKSCDLLIQLRSGVHIEIRGGGTSSRDDVDDVARGLPLRALATGFAAPDAPARSAAPAGPRGQISFRTNIVPILADTCAVTGGCHGEDPTHRVDLDLRWSAAYRSLVRHPSEMRKGTQLVEPGHPARSFLVDKLTHNLKEGEGKPMPLDPQTGAVRQPSPLETFVWATLVPWITVGAPEN
jgi:hypothetical protein